MNSQALPNFFRYKTRILLKLVIFSRQIFRNILAANFPVVCVKLSWGNIRISPKNGHCVGGYGNIRMFEWYPSLGISLKLLARWLAMPC